MSYRDHIRSEINEVLAAAVAPVKDKAELYGSLADAAEELTDLFERETKRFFAQSLRRKIGDLRKAHDRLEARRSARAA